MLSLINYNAYNAMIEINIAQLLKYLETHEYARLVLAKGTAREHGIAVSVRKPYMFYTQGNSYDLPDLFFILSNSEYLNGWWGGELKVEYFYGFSYAVSVYARDLQSNLPSIFHLDIDDDITLYDLL